MVEFRYQRAVTILEQMLALNLISPMVYDLLLERYQMRYAADITKEKK